VLCEHITRGAFDRRCVAVQNHPAGVACRTVRSREALHAEGHTPGGSGGQRLPTPLQEPCLLQVTNSGHSGKEGGANQASLLAAKGSLWGNLPPGDQEKGTDIL